MKSVTIAEIISVRENCGIYSMWLETGAFSGRAGQFVNVYLPSESRLLPRPISICEIDGNRLRLVFQISGGGTEILSKARGKIKILGGLGNGFEISPADRHILVGGGIGIPPLIEVGKQIRSKYPQAEVYACLGGRTLGFLEYLGNSFEKNGISVNFATDDGSLGHNGTVVDLINAQEAELYACGPRPMLRAVAAYDGNAQVSMEERMACGIGACVGCVVKTTAGYKKVCKDGPVFRGSEVLWND